jgi:RNA-directed DNA polymerase
VISPVIMNVALHGMEQAAGVRYWEGCATLRAVPGTPVLVRYADDLAVLCASRAQAGQVKERLAGWLEPRGLRFNEAKTRIVHLSQGFDFLGFSIRRYPNGKLLTKPSKEAMRRIRERLSTEATAMRGANADALIARLNPIITGWAAYYRIGVSKRAYGTLDAHLWRLAWKWANFSHPNKPRRWIITRHFGMFNPARQDKWVFGSRDTGFYLRKFAKSSGTGWSQGGRPPTTPPSPGTGSSGDAATASRSIPRPGTCCAASAAGARSAGDCSCTLTSSPRARRNGSSGTPSRARRSASTRSTA